MVTESMGLGWRSGIQEQVTAAALQQPAGPLATDRYEVANRRAMGYCAVRRGEHIIVRKRGEKYNSDVL